MKGRDWVVAGEEGAETWGSIVEEERLWGGKPERGRGAGRLQGEEMGMVEGKGATWPLPPQPLFSLL